MATPYRHTLLALSITLAAAAAQAQDTTLDTVTVVGQEPTDYQAKKAAVAGFDNAPLLDTPASVSVITEGRLEDQQARLLSEVLKNDASVGDSYAPVGYYENFVIRGFALNPASSYKINGRTITGEQNVALENKQQVEVLKGLAGLQSGVSEPGGLVNYVSKRPENVRSVTVSTNEQGERYLATDIGGWLGAEQQVGVRINLAHEDIRSYVEHADGKRDFASLALDWNISPNALLQLNAEYQDREQRSVPGYQLLGGTEVPHHVSPKDLLAYQSWSNPVGIRSLNLDGLFEYRFNDAWKASFSASRSRVVIDDYSTFAWGCYGAASCAGTAVPNHFSTEGDYDISDYRSPDDTRSNEEAQAALNGQFDTGFLKHDLTVGTSAFRRLVDRRQSVNEYIGEGNIYQPSPVLEPYDGPLGHTYRRLDSRQYGLFASDRISFNEQWQTILGGRQVRLDEETYNQAGATTRHTQRSVFLPQVALIYKPRPDTSLYASYSKGLSLGGEAAWFSNNADEVLPPTTSRQLEVGIKRDFQRLSLTAALFQITQDLQYNRPNDDGTITFVQQGKQKNVGIELSANGRVTSDLQVSASVAAIRAQVSGSGTDDYDGHQAINVPKLRASLHGDYSIPGVPGLALLGGVQYSASKYANREATVKVDDYAVFDVGGRYTTQVGDYATVLRLTVDNLFDKRYWRDVGESAGDGYLFLGAPRTARLSATVNF
ncbi:TonB-dependent siderophore receptor [Pseudomonas syringae]|uniref:TonB-dependent siderophore receptor n=1 Tax=Pseudomonas syringae TaxID=317 RepID=A0A9Q3ZYU6_PSESX|nr:TonB-dependent siderophore receptor [Pseudomonas syringae]MCF5063462.1 TonB-dependent siderophore receptor [Pseudomonas syringae]MCF5075356.1 TonB-dependent siderophore receptor [Pseudomonas syringae]MCF5120873.1 TonB-dependent siderophore receptor [Pseudomonas syringae]MCF5379529.1 TonB-dependent siderophore receptor [Pseudomonas syringae]